MRRSFVVTGAGRGVGRAIAERLLRDGHAVVVVELDVDALAWASGHVAGTRLAVVAGDAADEEVAGRAADLAQAAGHLTGWVNNAAVFRDADLHAVPAREVLDLIARNFDPVVVGCATAVRRFLATTPAATAAATSATTSPTTRGAIVNVSSHQAQRPVRGALAYATAKAATEGLTRALAVDYGPRGIRVNAVALGSIATERYDALLRQAPETEAELGRLHPLGRVGQAEEVASTVAFLLSEEAAFINGAVVPVDGGRSVLGQDPEQR